MKKFNFRLQTKLNISMRQEEIALSNLQASLNIREEIARELSEVSSKVKSVEDSIRNMNNTDNFQETVTRREYLPVLNRHKQQVTSHLNQAERKVEKARDILCDHKKETSTLEKLKEKKWEAYVKEVNFEEQRFIDEIAIKNHFRKKTIQG